MPQETNLNVSPYFDDFDRSNNYNKVLFKPGYPVQARELTTLQSILQNQIEQFGSHFFKEGAKVIPGQLTYVSNFYAVRINDEFFGIPVSLYLNNLVGRVIYGKTSGVKAKIVKVINSSESERGNITLYVDYLESSSTDFSRKEFIDGEVLYSSEAIQFGNTFISPEEGFASTISTDATSTGSAFALSNGIYFLRGTFVEVEDQILILDQYTNTPSYRVGLLVKEEIITPEEDQALNDNAQGYSNYSAPGADRLKITASLHKKDINDFNNANFVQLTTVQNGVLREINDNTDYNILSDELARRTFDESGHYYVKSFTTYCKESLDNGLGNGGIFKPGELTYSGSIPNEDTAIYKISPGKAYVKGYEIDFQGPTFLDVRKPRTTKTVENQAVNFVFNPIISVNNITSSPTIGVSPEIISLRNSRIGTNKSIPSGEEIGLARVYDFSLEQGGYDVENLESNKWNLSLLDIQTYSKLTLNEPVTLSVPTYVRGLKTGATGYLKESVSGINTITLYQINGRFSEKENITFNDIDENQSSRYIVDIKNYDISDVKSVYLSNVGFGITFSADTVQVNSTSFGNATITAENSGISTVIVNGTVDISGAIEVGNIVKYTQPGISSISYAKVESISTIPNQFEISSVASVNGVVYGELPTSDININDLTLVVTKLEGNLQAGNQSKTGSLYTSLPKNNIKSVDLNNSQITIRKQLSSPIVNNTIEISAGTGEVFLPYDEERYILVKSDGNLERLSSDKFEFQDGSTTLKIKNLSVSNDSGAVLISTLRKTKVKSKIKKKKVVDSVIINKSSNSYSGIGQSTTNDGLIYGNYPYGTRVQDKEICINYPDVIVIYAIYESKGISDPSCPSAIVGSLDGTSSTTNDLIIGETIIGTSSGAKALYAEKQGDNSIGFIYQSTTTFTNGETIRFSDSNVTGIIGQINPGSLNVTDRYKLDNGQRDTYVDYSRIIRNANSEEPQRKLKVFFMRAFFDISDDGDITTANSYNLFDYTNEIPIISNYRLTDLIDFRPRVVEYTVAEGNRSPFEFTGRNFSADTSSSKNIIFSDDSLTLNYSYYLPRADRIYLTKDRSFVVKYGVPSDNPVLPEEIPGAMNICNVYLPAYLYNTSDARVEFVQHKRYQMKDIFNLESRIKNLENYTSLTLLETNTQNLFIDDGNGQNRFKSGFYVDNFNSLLLQDLSAGVKNSIDPKRGELRPAHYTTNLKLEAANNTISGLGTETELNGDKKYASLLGVNIKKNNDVVTLDYSEVSWVRQPFATRTENVTPFFVKLWEGNIQLYPTADVWIDTNRLDINNVNMEGSFLGISEALRAEVNTLEDGERLGISPVIWNSWETTGIDVDVNSSSSTSWYDWGWPYYYYSGWPYYYWGWPYYYYWGWPYYYGYQTTTTTTTEVELQQQRTGVQNIVSEEINTESLGDRVVSSNIITFMRSRNIEFTARSMKPYTQVYAFFDGISVTDFCFSKLLEIEMISGTFQVGETVIGQFDGGITNNSICIFRVAKSNHKYGPYNNPTDFFDENPYSRDSLIPELYSSTSTILNVDTFSLAEESNTEFRGVVKKDMILRGQTSGAEARVTNSRLITDRVGTIIGSYQVPTGIEGSPSFETGRSRFKLTSSETNSQVPGVVTTVAEETFYSQGQVDNVQETTLSLRNARVEVNDDFVETRTISDSDTQTSVYNNSRLYGYYRDPLAQSFVVDGQTGIYLTKVDIYFRTKDTTLPVTVQIREMELGVPSRKILAFSEVELTPDKINTSEDASIPTSFVFDAPVYVESQKEYAIVILSNSNEYNLWISRLGEPDIATIEREQNQILVTTQTTLGSLFKSQNASTWTASQYEDLTFELYRADFVTSGSIQIFNSNLPENLERMTKDPLTIQSNSAKISLSSTITNLDLSLGNTVIQETPGLSISTGNLVGYAGSAFGELNIVSSGIGYTGFNTTYLGVALTSITGSGKNAIANITISDGKVVSAGATIVNGGSGYVIGDILAPIAIGSENLGTGMRLSVSQVLGKNELIVDSIQGEFNSLPGNVLKFINNSGITTEFTTDVIPTSATNVDNITSGDIIKVFHRNHGMHSDLNVVKIRDIGSDIDTVELVSRYPSDSGDDNLLFVSDVSEFVQYEGVQVSSSYKGYVRILNEILSYDGVNLSTNSLTGVSREIDNTKGFNYNIGTPVEKYELGGVSLRRINKTHNLSDVGSQIQAPINVDDYYIKIDMSSNGSDRSLNIGHGKLNFNNTKKTGGSNAKATYNINFDSVIPNIKQVSPSGTNIRSSIRTISGTSLGGNKISFVDRGVEEITNAKIHHFEAPRLIASRQNELSYLNDLTANKSLSVNLTLTTSDSRLSPSIDLSNNSLTLISNRINNPVFDYANDPRINTISDDPNLFTYTSNLISLESPSSSIKILLDAYVNVDSDLRALYSIGDGNIFVPFPGYNNIDTNGTVIDERNSDGSPDRKMTKQDRFESEPAISDFIEYSYTIDLNQTFKKFRIKLIGTSKNQAYVPIVRNLRVIALA